MLYVRLMCRRAFPTQSHVTDKKLAGSIAFNLCASTITVEPILSQKTTKGCKADHDMIHGVWGYYGHRVIFGKFKL